MDVHLPAPPRPPRSSSSVHFVVDSLDLQQVPVLSLDQIRAIRATNDYVERPSLAPPPPEPQSSSAPHAGFFFYSHHEDRYAPQSSDAPPPGSQRCGHEEEEGLGQVGGAKVVEEEVLSLLSRSSTVSSSPSQTSGGSNLRLLVSSQSGPLRSSQPKGGDPLKPASTTDASKVGGGGSPLRPEELELPHLFICERCGRCVCGECRAPRRLPSCWACGGRCLCSAQSAAEGATCLCCVKALFYHCSSPGGEDDDDPDRDSCADRPCSCATSTTTAGGHGRCCVRWGLMGALSLCLPCLCCYPPAALCVALCRRAHDLAARPGCRCDADANHTVVCRKLSSGLSPALHKHL